MDLGAYSQISDLAAIAKHNGIEVPRLRGYRLMKDEVAFTKEEISDLKRRCALDVAQDLCTAEPFWNPHAVVHEYSEYTDRLKDYYLIMEKDDEDYKQCVGIRWDRIHGKKRKILKFAIKKECKKIDAQFEVWNRYAKKENVLYIHSRMGGANWKYFDYAKKKELLNQPWFLDRVDDWWDSTYCDFYARIK